MSLSAGRYVLVLVAWTFIGVGSSRSLAAAVSTDLAGILAPALSQANDVIRLRQPPDATGVQINALALKQATALQRLKGAILGRTAVVEFVVKNVVNDTMSGGYDVEGTVVLPQPPFYNRAAQRDLAAAHSAYAKTLREIAKTDYNDEFTHPSRQKKKDEKAALAQLQATVGHIDQLVAPPAPRIVLHTSDPRVVAWKPGQTRTVRGRIISLRVRAETYSDITSSNIYPDSSDTASGGDYVACTIFMHWTAEIHSHAARLASRAENQPRGPALVTKVVPTVYLTSILQPALYKVNQIIRERQAPNATEVQIDALNAKQGAALSRFKGKLLGKKVVAVLVVTDVTSDRRTGGFDVDGSIRLHQALFYNTASAARFR